MHASILQFTQKSLYSKELIPLQSLKIPHIQKVSAISLQYSSSSNIILYQSKSFKETKKKGFCSISASSASAANSLYHHISLCLCGPSETACAATNSDVISWNKSNVCITIILKLFQWKWQILSNIRAIMSRVTMWQYTIIKHNC